MIVNCVRKASDQFKDRGYGGNVDADVVQFGNEVFFSSAQRQLAEKPEEMNESWIERRVLKATFGGVQCSRGDLGRARSLSSPRGGFPNQKR